MRFISLFAGIGGIDLGLERAGWTCVAQVERDEFCQRVLAKHWPDVPRFGDILQVRGADLPAADALVGGFPCQPVSVAGKRRGHEDERWLWPEFFRLVREVRPRWVLAENVPGLRTLGADRVIEDLESEGYTVRPLVVGADDVGAPHRRKRVFIVADRMANPDSPRCGARGSQEGQPLRDKGRRPEFDGRGPSMADTCRQGLAAGRALSVGAKPLLAVPSGGSGAFPKGQGPDQWEWEEPRVVELPMGGTTDGLPERLARKRWRDWNADSIKALGNAVVPQVAEAIGRAILRSMKGVTR